jgi:hypothetical protein
LLKIGIPYVTSFYPDGMNGRDERVMVQAVADRASTEQIVVQVSTYSERGLTAASEFLLFLHPTPSNGVSAPKSTPILPQKVFSASSLLTTLWRGFQTPSPAFCFAAWLFPLWHESHQATTAPPTSTRPHLFFYSSH